MLSSDGVVPAARGEELRVGLIGLGRIGRPVAAFLAATDGFRPAAILVRDVAGRDAGLPVTADEEAFFAQPCDLVIDTAGPRALALHGERALAHADLWSIGAAALADDALLRRLEQAGRRSGHVLRLLPGALAGLDGVAAICADDRPSISLSIARPGLDARFAGTAREAARLHPDEANVAVAAALAGAGLDATTVAFGDAAAGHRLEIKADASFGTMSAAFSFRPLSAGYLHPVSASIIAALKRERQVIRVG